MLVVDPNASTRSPGLFSVVRPPPQSPFASSLPNHTKPHRETAATNREAATQRFAVPDNRLAEISLPTRDDLVPLHVLSAGGAQHRAGLADRRIGGALRTTTSFTEALAPRSSKRSRAARESLSMSSRLPEERC